MRSSDSDLMNVAHILDRAAAKAFGKSAEKIISIFDEAEEECIPGIESGSDVIEIKRRVTEWKIKLLCDQDAPFELVEALYKKLLTLGYSDLENEANIEIYFAQYCIRNKNTRIAKQHLNGLIRKLSVELKNRYTEAYCDLKLISEKLLSKC